MDGDTEELLLQKLEELVFDEDKIITISMLCEKFDISLVDGQHVLNKFVSDQQLNSGKISATYLLSGMLKSESYGIQVVDAVLLKDKRKLFKEIYNEIVYSVQRNNSIDFNTIALTENCDNVRTKALKGSIVSDQCIERNIKTKILPPVPPQKNFEKQKPSFFKVQPKTHVKGDEEKTAITPAKNDNKAHKKTGGLSSFLSQGSQTQKPMKKDAHDLKVEVIKTESQLESQNSSEIKQNGVIKLREHENDKKSSTSPLIKKKGSGKEDNKKQKYDNHKKSKDKDGKKRKRIIMESDSDDDLFGKDEDEKMEVVESDEERPIIIASKESSIQVPKNKQRKAVQKTYKDEDGYVVTKTEYVLVSASEDEENIESQKGPGEIVIESKEEKIIENKTESKLEKRKSPTKAGSKAKKSKILATNQATLMNFFKKK